MIKLTLHPQANSKMCTFDKMRVIIGAANSPEADLHLSDECLQNIHVEILENQESFQIINRANDPFVSLNGLPFGKKLLKNGDLIQIGKTRLQFEGELSSNNSKKEPEKGLFDPKTKLEHILEEAIHKTNSKEISLHLFPEQDPTLNDLDIDALVREVEEFEIQPQESPCPSASIHPFHRTIKDLHPAGDSIIDLNSFKAIEEKSETLNLEEENEEGKIQQEPLSVENPKSRWYFWAIFFLLFFIILFGLGSAGLYIYISDVTKEEEIRAAESIADVSMALKYAQINHIKPHKQNWSDPEFLKNSLASILPHYYPSLTNIDAHGRFTNTPYILRLYTSSDFSRFLVIAQPAPSLFQWLIPKHAILVDSTEMNLRKLVDLKALNRLLVNADPLEENHATEISLLVKQGEMMPLSSLVGQEEDSQEFAPPKALSLIRPGAENLIYNAPRYYQVGETMMKRAVKLTEATSDSHEVSRLKQEMDVMSKMVNIVLYTTKGMQYARKAQKALAIFIPEIKFLTAYLTINSKGIMTGCHLMIEEELSNELDRFIALPEGQDLQKTEELEKTTVASSDANFTQNEEEIDKNHPLIFQFSALLSERQAAFKPHLHQLNNLLNQNTHEVVDGFVTQFKEITENYEKTDQQQNEKLAREIRSLIEEYESMPVAKLMQYAKIAGAEKLFQQGLKMAQVNHEVKPQLQIDLLLQKIKEAPDFVQLDQNLSEIAGLLTLVQIPNPDDLMDDQTLVHTEVIQKLNAFLLKPVGQTNPSFFSEQSREALIHILKTVWFSDDTEMNYYLNEFDLLKNAL